MFKVMGEDWCCRTLKIYLQYLPVVWVWNDVDVFLVAKRLYASKASLYSTTFFYLDLLKFHTWFIIFPFFKWNMRIRKYAKMQHLVVCY